MVLEIIALQWICDGFKDRQWMFLLAGILLFVFDLGTDLLGFPT